MAALSGGERCIKYLMFAFNLVFWVSVRRQHIYSHLHPVGCLRKARGRVWAARARAVVVAQVTRL